MFNSQSDLKKSPEEVLITVFVKTDIDFCSGLGTANISICLVKTPYNIVENELIIKKNDFETFAEEVRLMYGNNCSFTTEEFHTPNN